MKTCCVTHRTPMLRPPTPTNKLHEYKHLTQTQHEHNRLKPNIKVRYMQHTFTNTSAETLGCKAHQFIFHQVKASRFVSIRQTFKNQVKATSVSSNTLDVHSILESSYTSRRNTSLIIAPSPDHFSKGAPAQRTAKASSTSRNKVSPF